MAYCSALLLAKSVSLDAFSKSVSIHDVAEDVVIDTAAAPTVSEEAPGNAAPFGLVAVGMLRRDNAEVAEEPIGRLIIVSPKGREFAGPEMTIDLRTAGLARTFSSIPELPFTGDGIYGFRLQLKTQDKWTTVKEFTVPVKVTVTPPQPHMRVD